MLGHTLVTHTRPLSTHTFQVLEVQGGKSLSPSERSGLHPLLVPLSAAGNDVTCLLRWPEPSQYKVRQAMGSAGRHTAEHHALWAPSWVCCMGLVQQLAPRLQH